MDIKSARLLIATAQDACANDDDVKVCFGGGTGNWITCKEIGVDEIDFVTLVLPNEDRILFHLAFLVAIRIDAA